MAATSVLLQDTLDDLYSKELKSFKGHLTRGVPGFEPIPRGHLETADVQDTVDMMVQAYQDENAVKITLKILILIRRNDLVEKLNKHSARFPVDPPANPPTPSGQNFIKKHRGELENRMGELQPVLLKLQQCNVLNDQERDKVDTMDRQVQRNKALLGMVVNKGSRAQEQFYQALKDADPYFVEDLEGQP